jgi:hypothetical protein
MALAICGQLNRAAMRRRFARTPGWCMECSDWKTASLYWMGTRGRNTPVETSPSREASLTACACDLKCGRVHHLHHLWAGPLRSGHRRKIYCLCLGDGGQNGPLRCNQALLRPVLGGGGGRSRPCCQQPGGGQLKASAITFSWPGVCLMCDVNSLMKDSCHCWQADQAVWCGKRM